MLNIFEMQQKDITIWIKIKLFLNGNLKIDISFLSY